MSLKLRRPFLEATSGPTTKVVAVLQRNDDLAILKLVEVPAGKTMDLYDREWLRPHLSTEWHIQGWHEIGKGEDFTDLPALLANEIRWLSRQLLRLKGEDHAVELKESETKA